MKFVILCIIVALSKGYRNDLFRGSVIDNTQTTFWFDQFLDHYDPTNQVTFKQRYHVYDNSVEGTPKMVVLYICGEWTCDGIGEGQLPFVVADRYKGIILVLEHRYYGQSQPFLNWETKNLKYLTIQQALDDLANFIQTVKSQNLHGIPSDIPWIHMGGSYPGALSAWFRYKYPHLTLGGLASSAVVLAVADYYKYDHQVYLSSQRSGQECVDAIQAVNVEIENQLTTDRVNLLKKFNAEQLSDIEFLSMIADIYAGMVQGRQRTKMCSNLQGKTPQEQFQAVVDMAAQTVRQESYGADFLKKTTIDFASNARQWTYQTCVEMGYFQTSNPDAAESTRSQQLKIDFFQNLCQHSYDASIFPDEARTNAYFGGTQLNVDNLIFSNGSDDPWQHASITQDDGRGLIINFIQCDDCSHCCDLKAPSQTDPAELIAGRQLILDHFDQWLGITNQNIQS